MWKTKLYVILKNPKQLAWLLFDWPKKSLHYSALNNDFPNEAMIHQFGSISPLVANGGRGHISPLTIDGGTRHCLQYNLYDLVATGWQWEPNNWLHVFNTERERGRDLIHMYFIIKFWCDCSPGNSGWSSPRLHCRLTNFCCDCTRRMRFEILIKGFHIISANGDSVVDEYFFCSLRFSVNCKELVE